MGTTPVMWRGVLCLAGEVGWSRLPRQAQAVRMAAALAMARNFYTDQPIQRAKLATYDGRVWFAMTTEDKP